MKRRVTIKDLFNKSENLKKWTTLKEFRLYWDLFCDILVKELISTGFGFKLPNRMGTLQIRKKKSNKKSVDFYNTKKYGKTIYLTNNHSEGYYAFLHWDIKKPFCYMRYKSLYKFSFTRDNKRYLAKQIKNKNTISKYFEAI